MGREGGRGFNIPHRKERKAWPFYKQEKRKKETKEPELALSLSACVRDKSPQKPTLLRHTPHLAPTLW